MEPNSFKCTLCSLGISITLLCASLAKADPLIDPDDPHACVPPVIYQSPFLNYEPWHPIKRSCWIKANQIVQKLADHSHHGSMSMNTPHHSEHHQEDEF